MKIVPFGEPVLTDPTVRRICHRANAVCIQLERQTDPSIRLRLQSQYDAYLIDLADVVRSVVARTTRRVGDVRPRVDRVSLEQLLEAFRDQPATVVA